jgi:hypothetical protein
MAIDSDTDGTVMRTEFQKPRESPSQLRPGAGRRPGLDPGLEGDLDGRREDVAEPISSMPLSDVTTIT